MHPWRSLWIGFGRCVRFCLCGDGEGGEWGSDAMSAKGGWARSKEQGRRRKISPLYASPQISLRILAPSKNILLCSTHLTAGSPLLAIEAACCNTPTDAALRRSDHFSSFT
jgi:hypothetical protein